MTFRLKSSRGQVLNQPYLFDKLLISDIACELDPRKLDVIRDDPDDFVLKCYSPNPGIINSIRKYFFFSIVEKKTVHEVRSPFSPGFHQLTPQTRLRNSRPNFDQHNTKLYRANAFKYPSRQLLAVKIVPRISTSVDERKFGKIPSILTMTRVVLSNDIGN